LCTLCLVLKEPGASWLFDKLQRRRGLENGGLVVAGFGPAGSAGEKYGPVAQLVRAHA
jgi:hypothetical protein